MPLTASIVLRYTILITSIILVVLSIVTLDFTAHAMKTMASWFPPSIYNWSNPFNPTFHVRLYYDWTTENLILVTSALTSLAGCLGLISFVWNKAWKSEEYQKSSFSSSAYLLALPIAFGAFGTAFASNIWTHNKHAYVQRDSCTGYEQGATPLSAYTCTRELLACQYLPFIMNINVDARQQACFETHTSRMILIPLAVFSFILTAALAIQSYRDARVRKSSFADERVDRLQEDN